MASVLVDLDDLKYIDEVTDVEEDSLNSDKSEDKKSETHTVKQKRAKNIPVGENLQINTNNELVLELRKDRSEKKRKLDNTTEEKEQSESDADFDRLAHLIKNREQNIALRELREERARKFATNQQQVIENTVHVHEDISVREQTLEHIIEATDANHTRNKRYHLTGELGMKDTAEKLRKDIEDNSETNHGDNTKGELKDLNNVNAEETKSPTSDDTDGSDCKPKVSENTPLISSSELDDEIHSDRDKEFNEYQQCPDHGKTVEELDDKMNDKSKLLDSPKSEKGIKEHPTDHFNGARPKRFKEKSPNIEQYKLSDLNGLKNSRKDKENWKNSGKENKSKKKRSRMSLELPESSNSTTSPGSDIKILITNEDGIEIMTSPSTTTSKSNGNMRELWHHSSITSNNSYTSVSSNHSYASNSSNDASSLEEQPAVPLNFLRKMDEEKSNNLLKKQELYNQQKAKPFPKFAKVKMGIMPVAVEGDSKSCNIKAITLMPDKKFVMFDKRNKCLKLFDNDFMPLDRVYVNDKHCSLTALSDESIAVTLPRTKTIQLYHIDNNLNTLRHERTHPATGEFYSVSCYHNKLYLIQRYPSSSFSTPDEWQIKKIRLNKKDDSMRMLRTFSPGDKDSCLWANEHGLYLTNRLENEVLMLKHDGTFLYRHKVEFCLPTGITSDRFGNIYCCGGSVTSFIEIIKPDLRKYRLIYTKTSSNPVALCFDKDDNILYVCDQILGKVIKYKIEHNGTVQGLMRSLLIQTHRDSMES